MIMKRVFSFVLAFVMLLSMVPVVGASESNTLDVSVTGLSVTCGQTVEYDHTYEGDDAFGKAVEGDNPIQWVANGDQIQAMAPEGLAATLTFQNDLSVPATLRFDYSFEHTASEDENEDDWAEVRGLDGDAGSFEIKLGIGETYTITVISAFSGYGFPPVTLTISNLFLSVGGDATATFRPAENGSYTVNGEKVEAEIEKTAAVGTSYAVSATAANGYQFFGWYNGTKYISYKAEENLTINEDCTVYPVFIKSDVAVFGVGEARFQNLTDADAYASSGAVKTIVLLNDGILTGEHTVSAGNTLLIPYDTANSVHTVATSTAKQVSDSIWENKAWETPNAYRILTMAQGAKITIKGSLNVGGRHSSGPFLTAGAPSGDLGMIQMAEESNITVENGGVVYCWGYIYGDGTVTVKDGGAVHENFQFSDFRGGNVTLYLAQEFTIFPLSQYYVQNIEVATTFYHGATEYVWGSIYLQNKILGTAVKFIGNDADLCMFVTDKGGKVTKTYDPTTDRLVIDVEGDGSINPMGLELGGTKIDTATFALPINSNMTININSGTTTLNQSLALLPGVELNIAKTATLKLNGPDAPRDDKGNLIYYQGGHNLIIYDRDQWLNAYRPIFNNGYLIGATPEETYFVYTNQGMKRLQPVAYSPTRSYTRTEANLVDAKVDINGTLITDGFIYTTVNIDVVAYFQYRELVITGGGASVVSSNGTGRLVMNHGIGPDNITKQPIQEGTEYVEAYIPMISARLQNADGSYLDTLGATKGTQYNYCAACGSWYAGEPYTHMIEITWVIDGVGGPQEVCKNTRPVFNKGNDPVKAGFEFIGWSTGNDNEPEYTSANLPLAVEDAIYYACFREKATALLGDLNLDGKVNSDDLTALARHVAGIETVDGQALINADVNGDGEVNSDDLTMHARYVAGIITDWSQE